MRILTNSIPYQCHHLGNSSLWIRSQLWTLGSKVFSQRPKAAIRAQYLRNKYVVKMVIWSSLKHLLMTLILIAIKATRNSLSLRWLRNLKPNSWGSIRAMTIIIWQGQNYKRWPKDFLLKQKLTRKTPISRTSWWILSKDRPLDPSLSKEKVL